MKKLVALLAAGLLCGTTLASAQDVDLSALKAQIAELQKKVDELSKDMGKVQQHTVTDKVSLGIEFTTRLDSTQYKDVRGLPAFASDMMSLWLGNSLASTTGAGSGKWDQFNMMSMAPGQDGWNDVFMQKYGMGLMQMMNINPMDGLNATEMATMNYWTQLLSSRTLSQQQSNAVYQMFNSVKPKKYDTNNDFMLTNKLRVRLSSKVNENLSFTGRLTMYKTYGDTTPFRFFNGTMGSMNMDSNSAQVPTDDNLHVERAYFVYSNNIGSIPYHFSFGRRPA
ncbi:MAG: DUF3373 domain-containing protein, partial [Calditerrivibrio sp.]|nr:DUF3373 domain-containing protein [Calditerrivibrio sp.]